LPAIAKLLIIATIFDALQSSLTNDILEVAGWNFYSNNGGYWKLWLDYDNILV
jgi:hypothetical protein